MKIGIDIDGFLTDIATFQLEEGKKYFGEIINENGYSIKEIFNCSKSDEVKFWINNLRYHKLKARDNASKFVKYIHEHNGCIYIITSRALGYKKSLLGFFMRRYVKKWLKENNIYYDDILFVKEDKLKLIRKYNIDIMGEDSPINAEYISKEIKVILMDAPYNKEINNKNIYRIKDFNEGIDIIKNII